jgi:hypothetical protein
MQFVKHVVLLFAVTISCYRLMYLIIVISTKLLESIVKDRYRPEAPRARLIWKIMLI